MAPLSSVSRIFLTLLSICHLSTSVPASKPSNAVSLVQPSNAAAIFPQVTPTLFAVPSMLTVVPHSALKDDNIRVEVRKTYLIISQNTGGRTMPISQTGPLFERAVDDIRLKVERYGRDTVVQGPYEYDYGDLRLEAWQYATARASVTYGLIQDFISGLENNILRIGNVECGIDLYQLKEGEALSAGHAVLAYKKDAPRRVTSTSANQTILNETMLNEKPSSGTGIRTSLLLPGVSNGTSTASLQAHYVEYQVPNSETFIRISNKINGRTIPILDSLQLFTKVAQDLVDEIDTHEGEAALVDHQYGYYFNDLAFEAHGITERFTYHTVQDVVSGLKDVFWKVNYRESSVVVFKVIDGRSRFQVGSVTVAFQDAPPQWLTTPR